MATLFLASIRLICPRDEYDMYHVALFCELPPYDSMRDDEMTRPKNTQQQQKKTRKFFVFADPTKFRRYFGAAQAEARFG